MEVDTLANNGPSLLTYDSGFSQERNQHYQVFQNIGFSLYEAKQTLGYLSDNCLAQIAISFLNELRDLHEKGYIH
mgnify:CR=1 FL=1